MNDRSRRLISSGSPMERQAGYSRALVQGDWIFVSGTTGYDYATMEMPESVEDQTRNCFKTIGSVLEDAGAALGDIVRIRYYITDQAFAERVLPIFGEYLAGIRPAATLVVVAGLLYAEMKIEIEATALKVR